MDRKSKGKRAEILVKDNYESRGYEILEMNYRYKRAEIDLIALLGTELLVFVEVKMRTGLDYGEPETFVSNRQQERIQTAAEEYIYAINWKNDIRFDIASINAHNNLEIFEDAF